MKPINFDAIFFVCIFVHRQVPMVLKPYLRNGVKLQRDEIKHVRTAVELSKRFAAGKYEASRDEMARMIEAGRWLSALDCELKGISPEQKPQDVDMFFKLDGGRDLPEDAYDQVMNMMASGQV